MVDNPHFSCHLRLQFQRFAMRFNKTMTQGIKPYHEWDKKFNI